MKTILSLGLFFLISFSGKCQKGLEAGALIHPQIFGQIYDQALPDRAIKIPYSFAIGVNVGYNFNNYLGLRSGFVYSPQGEKYNIISSDPEEAYELNLEYIQVPLMLKLNGSPDKKIAFLLVGGPHLSYLNNATLTLDTNDPESVLGDFERLVVGASVGIGAQVNLDQGGNINFLWRTAGSLNPIQSDNSFLSRNISTGILLAYHYFITF